MPRPAPPANLSPRLLNREAAAFYCGMSANHFTAHLEPHLPVLEFGSKRLWDRAAIDAWLDRRNSTASGIDMDALLERA